MNQHHLLERGYAPHSGSVGKVILVETTRYSGSYGASCEACDARGVEEDPGAGGRGRGLCA